MIGIVIVAHGGLAQEYLAAVEHVIGPQSHVKTVAIGAECNRDRKQADICEAADAVDEGDGVVVVVDLFGGSPSNLALGACGTGDRKILAGANLPMLIKLSKSRHMPIADAVAHALDAGKKYMKSFDGSGMRKAAE